MQRSLRILIAEDEGLYRDLLRVALSGLPHFEVVGSYSSAEDAMAEGPALKPDVAVLDIRLAGAINGVRLGLELRRLLPSLGVVLLSNYQDPEYIAALPRDAVSGWSYLLKRSVGDLATLERAIEGSASGLVVLDPHLVRGLAGDRNRATEELTPRQKEILNLIAQGFTNAAIAQRLTLTLKSVENQINLMYQSLGIEGQDSTLQPRVVAVLRYLEGRGPRIGEEN